MNEALIAELRQEAATTRRVLERVPDAQLGWTPHAKSMTLGQLAMHTATMPGGITGLAQSPGVDVSTVNFEPPQPTSVAEMLATLDAGVETAAAFLAGFTPEQQAEVVKFTRGDVELMAMPRGMIVRFIMLNHWYHHRGQLSVYLRMLDIPIPVIYGRSADENPFG